MIFIEMTIRHKTSHSNFFEVLEEKIAHTDFPNSSNGMTSASLISIPRGEQGIRAKVPLKGLALGVLKVLSLWVPDRSQSSELSSAKVLM